MVGGSLGYVELRRKMVLDAVGWAEDEVESRRLKVSAVKAAVKPVRCIFVDGKRAINEIWKYKKYSGQPDARIVKRVSRYCREKKIEK